ncbi:MAG TPA: hypothetical protein VFY40_25995 [Blastocatellia bacterium]|nr:hypothetical protein [Blastocatellia bacterium]
MLRDYGLDESLEIPIVRPDTTGSVTLNDGPQLLITTRETPLRFFQFSDE